MDIFNLEHFKGLINSSMEIEESMIQLDALAALCELFGASDRKLPDHLKSFNPPREDWDQLVLFPGSFSPWHQGHEACVRGSSPLPVLIIPDANPWKRGRETDPWEDFKQIYDFVSKSKDSIYIYPGFLTQQESNPTVTWLPGLPLQRKRLLMGDDTFLSIHKWKEADKLLRSLDEIYVCPRQGEMSELLKQYEFLSLYYKINIFFLEAHDHQNLSSTELSRHFENK